MNKGNIKIIFKQHNKMMYGGFVGNGWKNNKKKTNVEKQNY